MPSLLAMSLAWKKTLNAIKVFKTNVTGSQRNGKDDTRIRYCRWIAGRRLTNGSIVNNFKLEEECSHERQKSVPKYKIFSSKLTTKWRNVCVSCLFGDSTQYMRVLSPIIFAYRTD